MKLTELKNEAIKDNLLNFHLDVPIKIRVCGDEFITT